MQKVVCIVNCSLAAKHTLPFPIIAIVTIITEANCFLAT